MTLNQRLDLAQRFFDQGRYAACLRLVEPLTARAPRTKDDLTAQRLLAGASYGLRRFALAEGAALRVVKRRPRDAVSIRLLVRILQRQGRHRDAAQWLARLDALGTDTWDDTDTAPSATVREPARRRVLS